MSGRQGPPERFAAGEFLFQPVDRAVQRWTGQRRCPKSGLSGRKEWNKFIRPSWWRGVNGTTGPPFICPGSLPLPARCGSGGDLEVLRAVLLWDPEAGGKEGRTLRGDHLGRQVSPMARWSSRPNGARAFRVRSKYRSLFSTVWPFPAINSR